MIPFKLAQGSISGYGDMPGYVAAGRVPISYENLENGADIMAHELGHNFNRQHAPCGVSPSDPSYPYANARLGDYGWDPQIAAGGKVFSWPGGYVVPATSFDVMSYCQDEWISEYTYQAILNYRGYSVASTGLLADDERTADQPYLFASGIITGEEAELDPWAILDRPEGLDDGAGEGAYQLRLVSASATVLFTRSFDVETSIPSLLPGVPASGVQDDETFSFYEILPWDSDTASIQLWHEGALLAERAVSAHAPVVEVTSPGSGASWAADGEYTIEWTASDDDGDSLWFDVAFSRDNGTTWKVITTRLEETHLDVSGDQFPGTEEAMLQVFASDGLLTSQATAGLFSIASKSPQAVIAVPQAGGTVPPSMQVVFKGYAYDPEDGMLDGEALSWNSDQDGALGTGSQVLTELSQGLHTITLMATDSDTNPGTATINVFVGYKVYLPLTLKEYSVQ